MNNLLLLTISLGIGAAVSYFVTTTEPVITCKTDGAGGAEQKYERHNRGFPLQFTSEPLNIPPCAKYEGPRCATDYCDNYPGLEEASELRVVPLVIDVTVWGLAAAGVLYMLSAIIIRK